jgi:tetratricopeptide (TPR) repeat protein
MNNTRINYRFAVGIAALAMLLAAATSSHAQLPSGVVTRPDNPLSHDPRRPNSYDMEMEQRNAQIGKEVDQALQEGNTAFAAKPARYADAEQAYLRAAKINPKEARAYMGLGQVYAAQNRADDTVAALKKAVELKPKFAEARFNLGLVYHALGKKDEAAAQYEALKDLNQELAQKLKDLMAK